MALHSVFYEFEVNRRNAELLIGDLGGNIHIIRKVVGDITEFFEESDNRYLKVKIHEKPGLMLRLSKRLMAERLPHPIEGAYAFIHSGSLGLDDFKTYFEASLSRHGIPFKRYD
jgi:hypothetical protein